MSRPVTTFEIACPQCQRRLVVNLSQVGARATCTDCLEDFLVPAPPRPVPKGTEKIASEDSSPESDVWADDRKQLNTLLGKAPGPSPPAAPSPAASSEGTSPEAAPPYDFAMACPLCGTRQDLHSEQIGRAVQCPDCHSKYRVREPEFRFRRPRGKNQTPQGDELQLQDLVSETAVHSAMRDLLDEAATSIPRATTSPDEPPRHLRSPKEISNELLAAASREEDRDPEVPLPQRPMTERVLKFLLHPIYLLRLIALAFAVWVEWGAIEAAIGLADAGPIQQFGSVILRPFSLVFGLLMAANFATSLLAIMLETAAGKDEIEGFPGVQPVEWFFESWPVTASCFLVMVLPAIAAQAAFRISTSAAFACLALPGIILFPTAFPVLLLSFLENSTPFSRTILQGLHLAGRHTALFVLQATGLSLVSWGLLGVRLNSHSSVVNFLAAVGLVLAASLYFRLLGRLTWVCQDRMADLVGKEDSQ